MDSLAIFKQEVAVQNKSVYSQKLTGYFSDFLQGLLLFYFHLAVKCYVYYCLSDQLPDVQQHDEPMDDSAVSSNGK